jgi:hypothetical protein
VFSGSDGEPGIRRCLYRDRESELLAEVRAKVAQWIPKARWNPDSPFQGGLSDEG